MRSFWTRQFPAPLTTRGFMRFSKLRPRRVWTSSWVCNRCWSRVKPAQFAAHAEQHTTDQLQLLGRRLERMRTGPTVTTPARPTPRSRPRCQVGSCNRVLTLGGEFIGGYKCPVHGKIGRHAS